MKSTSAENRQEATSGDIESAFKQRKGREPDKSSKEWLDWCWVWNRASKGLHEPIKRRVEAGQFNYDDFVMIWKSTAQERKRCG